MAPEHRQAAPCACGSRSKCQCADARASAVRGVLPAPETPLAVDVRSATEPRFGHDFSRVHVHADVGATAAAEAEADYVADQVMRMLEPGAEMRGPEQRPERLQQVHPDTIAVPPIVHEVLSAPGQPLDPVAQGYMEPRFGWDFSRVRVHSDTRAAQSARAVGARAYTVGQHLVFGAGQPSPETLAGRQLLAHELTHTVQQSSGNGPVLQRAPVGGPKVVLPPLEEVGNRIAALIRGPATDWLFESKQIFRGPVVSVIRDDLGRIYVAFNEGVPKNLTEVIREGIQAQQARIAAGEVKVVQTSQLAMEGGHAEVNALNAAIGTRERELGKVLTELELREFQLHNVWLSGEGALSAAPRCEHCTRITRGVSVTDAVFHAEGGVSGTILTRGAMPPTPTAGPAGGGSSAAGLAEGALAEVETGAALKVEGATGKFVGIATKTGRVAGFMADLLMPGPLEILGLWLAFFATIAEAKEKLRHDSYATGFSEGLAAHLLGIPADQATRMLIKPVPRHGEVSEQVAGVSGVRESATNAGAVQGWRFAARLSSQLRGAFLKEGFAAIKEKGRTIGQAVEPYFNLDDVIALAVAIRPAVLQLLEIAEEQERERARQKAQRYIPPRVS